MAEAMHAAPPRETADSLLACGTSKGGTPSRRFEAAMVPPERRRDALVGALDAVYYPCDFHFPDGTVPTGSVKVLEFGAVQAGQVWLAPVYVERTRQQISRRSGDYIFVPMPLRNALRLRQRGREAQADRSCFAFAASADTYAYLHDTEVEAVTLRIDAAEARNRIPNIEDLTATGFRAEANAAALFMDYARSFCLNAESLDPQAGAIAGRHLLDLFALAVMSGAGGLASTESAVREANRQRILRHVEAHLGDPDLGTASVARDLGLSERYIQKLLSERSETLSGVIRDRRIAEARRLLSDPSTRCRSIAAIAYQLGFTDPAYFSRVFREVTGISPREFRNLS